MAQLSAGYDLSDGGFVSCTPESSREKLKIQTILYFRHREIIGTGSVNSVRLALADKPAMRRRGHMCQELLIP